MIGIFKFIHPLFLLWAEWGHCLHICTACSSRAWEQTLWDASLIRQAFVSCSTETICDTLMTRSAWLHMQPSLQPQQIIDFQHLQTVVPLRLTIHYTGQRAQCRALGACWVLLGRACMLPLISDYDKAAHSDTTQLQVYIFVMLRTSQVPPCATKGWYSEVLLQDDSPACVKHQAPCSARYTVLLGAINKFKPISDSAQQNGWKSNIQNTLLPGGVEQREGFISFWPAGSLQ